MEPPRCGGLPGTGWHVITYARTSAGPSLTIDGTVVDTGTKKTGVISNTTPMTVAGKLHCKCDFWTGQVDYIKVEVR